MLKPKGADAEDTKGKSDEETGTKTKNKSKRLSCASCGRPTSPNKANDKTKPTDNEKPDEKSTADAGAKSGDVKAKSEEPHVDADAIKPTIKQNKALYTPLQPSSDPHDFSHYDEAVLNSTNSDNMNASQTGYADVDINSRAVAYDDFDLESFR